MPHILQALGVTEWKICFWTKDSEEESTRKGRVGKIWKFRKLIENALKKSFENEITAKNCKLFQSPML